MTVARSAEEMIGRMEPVIEPGAFVFVALGDDARAARVAGAALCLYREAEGLSAILPVAMARDEGLPCDQPMRCITLTVHSALDGVGLTAAVSGALAREGIPCNMVAAYHHDHAFVPAAMAEDALRVLRGLQASGSATAGSSAGRA